MGTKSIKKNAFTLIELLVVISIIALLLSILMPSLNKVRETAKRTVCGTDMHQTSLAYLCYANDFKGKIPPIVIYNPTFEISMSHGYSFVTAFDQAGTIRGGSGLGLLAPGAKKADGTQIWQGGDYLQSPSVFYCPSDKIRAPQRKAKNEWAKVDGYYKSSYEYMYIPPDWSRTDMPKDIWQPMQRWSTSLSPAARMVLKDQHFFGAQAPRQSGYDITKYPPYHPDGASVLRLGGSVSFIKNFKAPTPQDINWLYYFKYVDSH